MKDFKVLAVEPQLDGPDDIFGPEVAAAMRLPFDDGWDHWAIYQGDDKIVSFEDYGLAEATCSALNNTQVLQAA